MVQSAIQILELTLHRDFPATIWNFATDGGHLMAAGIPTIGFGPGDESLAHVANEHIEIDQMVEAVAGNAALVLGLTAVPGIELIE